MSVGGSLIEGRSSCNINAKEIEATKAFKKQCKQVYDFKVILDALLLLMPTPNMITRGEFCRYPLVVLRHVVSSESRLCYMYFINVDVSVLFLGASGRLDVHVCFVNVAFLDIFISARFLGQ